MRPVIELAGVEKSFKRTAVLRGATLSVPEGCVVGLLGTNGAGKSTLIKCLLGLLRTDAGSARVLGEDAWNLSPEVKQQLGYVPQEAQFYAWMKVRQIVAYWGTFYRHWDRAWVELLLDRWELPRDRRVGPLSPGQQQRLALVLALGHRPRLLVLDEPMAALDPIGRRETLGSLVDLQNEGDRTTLFSTHILSDLERVATHIAILAEGRIACFDELDALKDRVKRLRVVSESDLPLSFSVPGSLRTERSGRQALVAVANLDDALLRSLRETWRADVLVEDLNLEEIFIELSGRGRSRTADLAAQSTLGE
ncbi:MAG: ABC transporter ATP-binding protein [Planctomyces sp.]|nr:ABC transporter ATP-binding protein [Planctomyces sp.]